MLDARPSEFAALRKLRVVDAARVSNQQLEAVRQILLRTTSSESAIPIRIAAMHHHLLPVSAAEEIKPFESLTNLGAVRQFLRDHGFAMVLHGHKHTPFTYVDHIASYGEGPDVPAPLRVFSGAAASGGDLDRTDVCRLLDVDALGGVVRVRRVGLATPGTDVKIKAAESVPFSRPGGAQIHTMTGCTVITGESVEQVYPLLLARTAEKAGELEHVICRIEQSPEIGEIAPIYPKLPASAGSNLLKEFSDLVKWWQFPSVPLSPMDQPAFTHGSRIRTYNGHLDQIQQVIDSLQIDPATSRSMIVLLNPPADQIAKHEIPYPSFCVVQFTVQGIGHGSGRTLACTAYFRKQEVRYWWLVNLAELADLQRQICDTLRQGTKPELRSIKPGPITTVAARAHAGDSPPKVQVPLVDRLYGLSREQLYAMVHALIWEEMPDRSTYIAKWNRAFSELTPPENPDPDGVAIAQQGLKYLTEEIGRHMGAPKSRGELLTSLHQKLGQLLAANQEFALFQQKNSATSERYQAWRSSVMPLVSGIIELSAALITHEPSANQA